MVHLHLLPIVSIIVEPAKILFLNNAINHGVFTPLGTTKQLMLVNLSYLLLNLTPGPGLGILLAYMIFGKGTAKATSYGAGIIHFLGGIHAYEIYITICFLGFGFKSPASPGSFIVYCLNAPRGNSYTCYLV